MLKSHRCILGLVALIASGGCGSGPDRPTAPPPVSSSARNPPFIDLSEAPAVPLEEPRLPPFGPPLRAPIVATGDPELDTLVAYLKASFEREIKGGRRLVINDTTNVKGFHTIRSYQHLVDGLLSEASEQVPAEMIRDFCEKNRESRAVWPEMTRHLPATLLTLDERKVLFSRSEDGWERFYKKYPDACGIITVSRVGLNRDKSLALFSVFVNEGALSGLGQFHVLKKEGDMWVEVPIYIGPIVNI